MPNGINGYQGQNEYVIEEHPLGEPRRVRIVTVGAGPGGLNMARHLELFLTNYEHVIYEKNSDVGGTWFENRYIDCRLAGVYV
jgi:cation diffusion facilitator CzcD-associated flavoprotein CzcO